MCRPLDQLTITCKSAHHIPSKTVPFNDCKWQCVKFNWNHCICDVLMRNVELCAKRMLFRVSTQCIENIVNLFSMKSHKSASGKPTHWHGAHLWWLNWHDMWWLLWINVHHGNAVLVPLLSFIHYKKKTRTFLPHSNHWCANHRFYRSAWAHIQCNAHFNGMFCTQFLFKQRYKSQTALDVLSFLTNVMYVICCFVCRFSSNLPDAKRRRNHNSNV